MANFQGCANVLDKATLVCFQWVLATVLSFVFAAILVHNAGQTQSRPLPVVSLRFGKLRIADTIWYCRKRRLTDCVGALSGA